MRDKLNFIVNPFNWTADQMRDLNRICNISVNN